MQSKLLQINTDLKIVFLTLFLFITLGTYAHQDMIMSFNRGNIHFKYKTGYTNFEIGHKVNILTDLSTKLLKSKGYTTDIIYFYFEHDYTNRDSSFLALGYGQFAYWKNDVGNSTKHLTTNGLKINIRDRGFDIYRILNLINSAIKDVNLIKTTQEHFIIDLHSTINGISQFDTFFSIPTEQVNKYLSSSDSFIERLVNEKTYRNLEKTKEIRGIDYYYQNNKFHFYNTRQPDTKWSQEQKKHVINLSSV